MSRYKDLLMYWYQKTFIKFPFLAEFNLMHSKIIFFIKAWHYITRSQIEGDYMEFGVYTGNSFSLALDCYHKHAKHDKTTNRRFFAFASFCGLPEPSGTNDSIVFQKGDYSSAEQAFEKRIRHFRKKHQIHVVKGFYFDVLNKELSRSYKMQKAAFVNIDCDIFESTSQALEFIEPFIQNGTLIYFDDWFFSSGDMNLGEPGACCQWLKNNPQIQLIEYCTVGIMGKAFLVNINK